MKHVASSLAGLSFSVVICLFVMWSYVAPQHAGEGTKFVGDAKACINDIFAGNVDKISPQVGASINRMVQDMELMRDIVRACDICLSFEKDPKERTRLKGLKHEASSVILTDQVKKMDILGYIFLGMIMMVVFSCWRVSIDIQFEDRMFY